MRPRLLVALGVVALGVSGCGGSSLLANGSGPAHAKASRGSRTTSAQRKSTPPAASGTTAPASPASTQVKTRRRSAVASRPQIVAGTGSTVIPAEHLTISASAPLAQTPFVSEADSVCSDYRREVANEGAASTLPEQERIYSTIVDDATQAITSLQRLSPPGADRSLFQRYLTLTAEAIDDFSAAQRRSPSTSEATGTAVDGQDFEAFQALAGRVTAARAVARRLGFRVCGSPGSDWL
jgi:hypothetical protein